MSIEKIVVNGITYDIRDVEDVNAEVARAKVAESALQSSIGMEAARAKDAEAALQRDLASEAQRAAAAEDVLRESVTAEAERAQAVEKELRGLINVGGGVYLGSFDSASEFNNRLNTLTYDPAVTGKNIGFFRSKVSYRDVEIRNILLSSGLDVIVQVVSGTFVSANNILTLTDSGYNVYTRKRENGVWSAWIKWNGAVEGGSGGSVSDEQLTAIYAAINAEVARAQAAEKELRELIGTGGSVPEGLVSQVDSNTSNIEKLMKKTFPLTLSLSVSPSTLQKYTGQAKEFILSWGAKVADESVTPTSIVLTAGGTNIPVDTTATTAKVTASNDTAIKLKVTASGMTAEKTANITYAYAAYTGLVDKNFTITADEITQLKEMSLVDGKARSYTYDALELQKVVYAYAKVYGALTGIVDANNVNLIGNYTRSEIEINGIAYYVYITTEEFSTTGSVTYKYS